VPFTRAGCTVGDFSTANMVLENPAVDVPTVFGATRPRPSRPRPTPTGSRTCRSPKYVGEAIHCAQGDASATAHRAVGLG
jgi:hypothetical protein